MPSPAPAPALALALALALPLALAVVDVDAQAVPPVPPDLAQRCVARADDPRFGGLTSWSFPQWAEPAALSGGLQGGDTRGMPTRYSAAVRMCDRVDVLLGNVTAEAPAQWEGWNYGAFERVVYNGASRNGGAGGADQPHFVATYKGGDSGFPCAARGRNATLELFCSSGAAGAGGGANLHACPAATYGTTQNTCPQGATPGWCVCGLKADLLNDPCAVTVGVLIACPAAVKPHPVLPPNLTPPPPPGGAPTAGEVVGWIIFALLLGGALACIGGGVYNMQVRHKQGLDAVPFIHVLRGVAAGNGSGAGAGAAGASGGYGRTTVTSVEVDDGLGGGSGAAGGGAPTSADGSATQTYGTL